MKRRSRVPETGKIPASGRPRRPRFRSMRDSDIDLETGPHLVFSGPLNSGSGPDSRLELYLFRSVSATPFPGDRRLEPGILAPARSSFRAPSDNHLRRTLGGQAAIGAKLACNGEFLKSAPDRSGSRKIPDLEFCCNGEFLKTEACFETRIITRILEMGP
jgi:hypothetical protein